MQTRTMKRPWLPSIKLLIGSTALAAFAAAVLLLLAAFLLDKFHLKENQVSIMVYATYLVSALLGGFMAGKVKKERKFVWGILAGFVWFLVVLIMSLFLGEAGIDLKELFPAIVCMVGGGMLGGMLA